MIAIHMNIYDLGDISTEYLPPANEVWGNIMFFTPVCQSFCSWEERGSPYDVTSCLAPWSHVNSRGLLSHVPSRGLCLGVSLTETPRLRLPDRDPPGQRYPGQGHPPDRDPPGQRPP